MLKPCAKETAAANKGAPETRRMKTNYGTGFPRLPKNLGFAPRRFVA
jgi:hypothetical protein